MRVLWRRNYVSDLKLSSAVDRPTDGTEPRKHKIKVGKLQNLGSSLEITDDKSAIRIAVSNKMLLVHCHPGYPNVIMAAELASAEAACYIPNARCAVHGSTDYSSEAVVEPLQLSDSCRVASHHNSLVLFLVLLSLRQVPVPDSPISTCAEHATIVPDHDLCHLIDMASP